MIDYKAKDINLRSYKLSLKFIKLTDSFPKKYSVEIICKQAVRSITSICANIVEGKYASSDKDLIRFRQYSLKSCHETKYWIKLLYDLEIINKNDYEEILNELEEFTKILTSMILNLKKKK